MKSQIQDIAESTRIYENMNRFDEILFGDELSLSEEELVYKSKLINLQQSMFNKQLANGTHRFSSYLDADQAYALAYKHQSQRSEYANVQSHAECAVDLSQAIDAEIMREICAEEAEEETHGHKTGNLKKQLRNLITKKFKKFHQIMNLASSKENLAQPQSAKSTKKSRKSWLPSHNEHKAESDYYMSPVATDMNKCQARLVNFNYKSSFFNDQILPVKTPASNKKSFSIASKRRTTHSSNNSSNSSDSPAVVASQSASKDKSKRMKMAGIYANESGINLTPITCKRFKTYLLEEDSMAVNEQRRMMNSTEKNIYQSIMQFNNNNLSKVTRSAKINNCHHSDGESSSSASSSASSSTSSLASCVSSKKSFALVAPCSIRYDNTRSQLARSAVLGKSVTANVSSTAAVVAKSTQDAFKFPSTVQFDQAEISTSTPVVTRKSFKTPVKASAEPESSLDLSFISTKSESCCTSKSCTRCAIYQQMSQEDIYEQETCDNAAIGFASQMLDQSTQALTESPVLLESTFDTSSVSNLSDDLIILQTAAPVRPASSTKKNKPSFKKPLSVADKVDGFVCSSTMKRPAPAAGLKFKSSFQNSSFQRATCQKAEENDWNLMVINKFHENTDCSLDNIPEWAQGTSLKLALVNQAYFNPGANGVFKL